MQLQAKKVGAGAFLLQLFVTVHHRQIKGGNKVSIAAKVREIVSDQLGLEESEVQNHHSFEELGADSLDLVELIMEFEDEYEIEIPDADAEKIFTVQQAIDYVVEHT